MGKPTRPKKKKFSKYLEELKNIINTLTNTSNKGINYMETHMAPNTYFVLCP